MFGIADIRNSGPESLWKKGKDGANVHFTVIFSISLPLISVFAATYRCLIFSCMAFLCTFMNRLLSDALCQYLYLWCPAWQLVDCLSLLVERYVSTLINEDYYYYYYYELFKIDKSIYDALWILNCQGCVCLVFFEPPPQPTQMSAVSYLITVNFTSSVGLIDWFAMSVNA